MFLQVLFYGPEARFILKMSLTIGVFAIYLMNHRINIIESCRNFNLNASKLIALCQQGDHSLEP